jgi:hypothetical protein
MKPVFFPHDSGFRLSDPRILAGSQDIFNYFSARLLLPNSCR